ncbi:ribosomal protein S20 [Desulfofarcimen acetoxidans DSM 771]|jgi:small subunit ribosomal protein S20|uniref:Small ribosomal subunit protein bS20 n=1 Tax=Desulfofarcimen acetoxidans (strain ATCC 49208 / DSM 771 / KCTC 5769 / VKM B-1644 / 5575) TaxID=485916 RepID=C8W5J4_DESAS|nr:30S ribosomal protein S20 [Desulfofarcimen acetoxidans]ACV63994.1 ribosomal protein S20 [Desulfofarcimen acetoxidans DSM 771]
MPNIKSAAKRVKTIRARTLRNNIVKSQIKTAIRRFEDALAKSTPEEVQTVLRRALVLLDKAASKGVLHKNKAARKKSRLTKQFNRMAG